MWKEGRPDETTRTGQRQPELPPFPPPRRLGPVGPRRPRLFSRDLSIRPFRPENRMNR